jgi:benzylsuccinate CoA-transferase BbsF subunit
MGEAQGEGVNSAVGVDGIRPPGESLHSSLTGRPLEGIRILDFCQVVTGPLATRILADHGAEVIRVEWGAKAQSDRYIHPRVPGNDSPNVAALRYWFNTSKRDLTLDLRKPEARALLTRLVRTADVAVDNFGVDPFFQWGLSYDKIRELRPDLIVARSSMAGRTGPKAGMVGFGHGIGALAGWNQLMGFPGEPPFGMRVAYPDSTANCHHLLIAILTALEHRRRTGEGQFIDLSQYESTVTWLGPAILDFTANGRPGSPSANRHPDFAPHGVYPAAGVNRWIAIAVDPASWPAFVEVAAGDGVNLSMLELATHAGRKAHEDELDDLVRKWSAEHDPIELAERLQNAGVAAYVAADGHDLLDDPQLAHRQHYVRLEHPEAGMRVFERHPFELRGTPATIERAPLLGEDNDWALAELLGMSEAEVAQAYVEGILG